MKKNPAFPRSKAASTALQLIPFQLNYWVDMLET